MRAPARHSIQETSAYGPYGVEDDYARGDILPGERIGPPLGRNRGKMILRLSVITLIGVGGWALIGDKVNWSAWSSALSGALFSSMERRVVAPAAPAFAPAPVASAEATLKPRILDTPASALPPAAASKTTAAAPSAPPAPLTTAALPPAAGFDAPPGAPLPPPVVDPADPYQKRAEAVGLHPGLSRVLLARLSPTDYHNAGIAIQTAVAKTPDGSVFVWPRQRKPELALFQVHFVPGAAPDCRRYVVTVAKDGWLTTALPMEKCGVGPGRTRHDAAADAKESAPASRH